LTRCVACGAANPSGASWCNQCLGPLPGADGEVARPAPPPAADRGVAAREAGEGTGNSAAAPAGDPVPDHQGFRRHDGRVEWGCTTCGAYVDVERPHCPVCGTALVDRFAAPRTRAPEATLGVSLSLSALLPGAGHLACGQVGTGVARALLFTVWVAGGLALWGAAGTTATAAALPLLLGAATVWLASLLDVFAVHAGGRQVLGGRTLLWLVVGVTGLTLAGAAAVAGSSVSLA
jgi:hypothetical protein